MDLLSVGHVQLVTLIFAPVFFLLLKNLACCFFLNNLSPYAQREIRARYFLIYCVNT